MVPTDETQEPAKQPSTPKRKRRNPLDREGKKAGQASGPSTRFQPGNAFARQGGFARQAKVEDPPHVKADKQLRSVINRLNKKTIEASRGQALVSAIKARLELWAKYELETALVAAREEIAMLRTRVQALLQTRQAEGPMQ